MEKKELQKKLAGILNVPEEMEGFAFVAFKKYLTEYLETGKAIKIPELGIFQIKREPVPREERQGTPETKDYLIFTPAKSSEELSQRKVFLQIPVSEETSVSERSAEELFSLSINKPVAPLNAPEEEESVEEKVKNLIGKAEKLENFDVFSILFEEGEAENKNEEEILKESFETKEVVSEEDNALQTEEEKEEEIWNDELEKELLKEEVKEDEVSAAPELTSVDEENVPTEEEANSTEEPEPEEVEKEAEPEEVEEDPFGALEESINKAVEKEIPEEEIEEIIEENENALPEMEEETETEEEENAEQKEEEEELPRKSKKKYYYLGVALLLILFYFIFFTGGEKKQTQKIPSEKAKPVKTVKPEIVAKIDSAKPVKSASQMQTESKLKPKTTIKQKVKPAAGNAGSSLYRKIKKERSVAKNIYYNGNEYMVQLSSWRNSLLAELETKRLRKKGLKAFIVEAYVRKFKRKYYRVRIGGFKTLNEAKIFRDDNIK